MRHAYLLLFPLSLVLPQTVLAQQGTLVGEKVDRTIETSATRFDAKAARDKLDPAYCCRTAVKLENGDGASQHLPGALAWHRKAAGLGHAEEMAALGQLYHSGRGVERDEAQAVHWYRQAAGAGSVIAAYTLAVILASSATTPRNLEQARRFYEQAAAGGFAKAQFTVETGDYPDLETAMVNHVIRQIRTRYPVEIKWDSTARGRVVTLSMRIEDHEALVKFLRVELFGKRRATSY